MCQCFLSIGLLSDAKYGPHLRPWTPAGEAKFDAENGFGQAFIAIDVSKFAPGFQQRNQEMMEFVRNLAPAEEGRTVLVIITGFETK